MDLIVLMGGTAFLLITMFTGKRRTIDRWEAVTLLSFYLFYTIYLIVQEL